MKDNFLEIIVGSLVLFVAIIFVIFVISTSSFQKKGQYINAEFGHTGGLNIGDDVVISGIKVGEVSSNTLNQETYIAVVTLNLNESILIPEDSIAKISSKSLLGGLNVEIIPGASDQILKEGDTIYNTRDPVNISDLLGKAVFSGAD